MSSLNLKKSDADQGDNTAVGKGQRFILSSVLHILATEGYFKNKIQKSVIF